MQMKSNGIGKSVQFVIKILANMYLNINSDVVKCLYILHYPRHVPGNVNTGG